MQINSIPYLFEYFTDQKIGEDAPLWGSVLDWTSINGELAGLVSDNAPNLGPAFRAAQEVRQAMERLIPVWEQLCAATYAQCQDNCCTAQRVWFEFRDLLLFHLLGLAIPPARPGPSSTRPADI